MPERPTQSGARKIALVAWREFRHTALTKGFIFGAVAVPLLMFGVIALMPLLLSRESPPLRGTILLVDPSGAVLPRAQALLAKAPSMDELSEELAASPPTNPASQADAMSRLSDMATTKVEVAWRTAASTDALEAAKPELRAGTLLAAAAVSPEALDPAKDGAGIDLLIPSALSPKHVRMISRAIREAVEAERIQRSGVDGALIARLASVPSPTTVRISPEGAEAEERTELRLLVPGAFLMLLWITIFTSANYLLTTTIEEKSNKVMEVLLAAVSPMQLLVGKIAGYSLVSLVMLVMYGGLGLAGLSAAAMMDLVPTTHLVYLAICFVMAYMMVSSMMAAVGSAVSDLREAQSLVTPVMLLLVVPIMLWAPIIDNPNGVLATVTSFIPPASPFVLLLRLTASTEPIPMWQTVAAIAWGFLCTYAMLWLAARIFRVGVLMQGKPPTPRELIKWAFVR